MNALRHLDQTNEQLGMSVTRLSSGLRINNASDDPAGLIISEGLRAKLRGIEQAVRNSQDAINMAKTAEGALSEVQLLLRNIRGLAVHSANTAVVDSAQLQANQSQIRSTIQSITRIAEQTQWGNKRLLDGTAGIQSNVTDINDVATMYFGSSFNGESVVSGPVTVQRTTSATRATVALGVNFASANTIVTTPGTFVINGYSFSSSGTETVSSLVQKINQMSQTTGVTASITGAGPVSITLSANDYGSQFPISFFDPSNVIHNASSASSVGVDAVFNVTMTTTAGVTTAVFTGGRGPKESGLKLSDNYGNTILLTQAGNAGLASPTQVGVVTAGAVQFQIGADSNQATQFSMPTVFPNRLGTGVIGTKSLADIDVTTQAGAQEAMRIIDAAISQLALQRGELGSFQTNFLDSTARSLAIAQENLTASESAIRDADMASEISQYTRLQVLQQSGLSVLAQANQAPQNVLQLLRGG